MRFVIVVSFAVVLSACGPTSTAEYQAAVAELQSAVTTYENDSATTTSQAECEARFQAYATAARPRLQRMMGMSDSMDLCGRMMGRMPSVQFRSMCSSMDTELERYSASPCGPDVTVNHEQASTHCLRMREWIGQQTSGMQPMMGQRCSQ